MNIEFNEFIDEVKDEIMCYEELGEEYAQKWEEEFLKWADENKNKNKSIKESNGKMFFVIKDESEIFEIADSYYDAVVENSVGEYWKKF